MATDEQARLAALQRYQILDSDPEQAFDDLTMLASHICGTPIALITLLDADRQWFKARVGVSAHETARSVSFCTHAIKQREIYVVPDATQDTLFKENPFVVGEPGIRFYAGAPLVTPDGHALGTLCVVDQVPRQLTAEQTEALEALRRQAQDQLELRLNLMQLKEALVERERADVQQLKLIGELRSTIDEVKKLSALVPYCSACQFDMVIPADPAGDSHRHRRRPPPPARQEVAGGRDHQGRAGAAGGARQCDSAWLQGRSDEVRAVLHHVRSLRRDRRGRPRSRHRVRRQGRAPSADSPRTCSSRADGESI